MAPGYAGEVVDTAANIQSLTPAQIAMAPSVNFVAFASNDASIVLDTAQAEALVGAGLPMSAPSGDTVTISDTATNLQTLTPTQIDALSASGISAISCTDGAPLFSIAQLKALYASGVTATVEISLSDAQTLVAQGGLTPPTNSSGGFTENVVVLATAAQLEALTPSQLGALAQVGVTGVAATDHVPVLDAAQMAALGNASFGSTTNQGQNPIALIAPPGTDQNDGQTTISGPAGDGMTFYITWDTSVASAPATFKAQIEAAFQWYADTYNDPTPLYYDVGYGEEGGDGMGAGDLGESGDVYDRFSYVTVASALQAAASPDDPAQQLADANLADPSGNPNIWLETPQAQALGLTVPASSASNPDGAIGISDTGGLFSSALPNQTPSSNTYDVVGAAEHEISEVMGRTSGAGGNETVMDLFRYSGPGQLQTTNGSPSYFSIDDGVTNLGNWNDPKAPLGDGGDLGDWLATNPYTPDSYNDVSAPGHVDAIAPRDATLVNLLGYNLATPTADPQFAPIANDLFFDGLDTSGRNELWVSNGTSASTKELIGVDSIAGDLVYGSNITAFGKEVLFNGSDLYGDDGLWVSDGTAAGTRQITGIANVASAAQGGLDPTDITAAGNGELWFDGTDASGKVGLWETDGTAAGTKEIVPGLDATDMTLDGSEMYFVGSDQGLWETNGTSAGTKELFPAAGVGLGELNGTPISAPGGNVDPYDLDVVNGVLVFGGYYYYQYQSNGQTYTINSQALFEWTGSEVLPLSAAAPGGEQPAHIGQIVGGPSSVVTVDYYGEQEAFYQGDYDFGVDSPLGGGLWETDGTVANTGIAYGDTPNLVSQLGSPDPVDLAADYAAGQGFLVYNGEGDLQVLTTNAGNVDLSIPQTLTIPGEPPLTSDAAITGAWASGVVDPSGQSDGLDPTDIVNLGGVLYFSGYDAAGDLGLWVVNPYGYPGATAESGLTPFVTETHALNDGDTDSFLLVTADGYELTGISGANAGGIDPTNIAALYIPGPASTPVTAGELLEDLTLNQINSTEGFAPSGSEYILTDTAIDVESVTAAEFASAKTLGLGEIYVTDGSLELTVGQVEALEDPVPIVVPAGDTVTVLDDAAAIEGMSQSQLAGLGGVGVTNLAAIDASVTLTLAQALTLGAEAIPVAAPAGDIVTVAKVSAADVESLTPAQILALGAAGVGAIDVDDTSVVLQPLQAQAFSQAGVQIVVPAGDTVTTNDVYSLSVAEIDALTTTQIAAIGAAGYVAIQASSSGEAMLTAAQALALEDALLPIVGSSTVTVSLGLQDTAADLEALTPAELSDLATLAPTLDDITATDASLQMSIAQAEAIPSGSMVVVPGGDVAAVWDSQADIQALTPGQIATIAAAGFTEIASPGYLNLNAAQVAALELDGLQLVGQPGHYVYLIVQDTPAAIEALTPAEIAGLPLLVPTSFIQQLTANGSLTFDIAQAAALGKSGVFPQVPFGDTVTVSDTPADIDNVTAAQVLALNNYGFTTVAATTGPVVLTAAAAAAIDGVTPPYTDVFTDGGLSITSSSPITVADTAANLEQLTPAQIAGLPDHNVNGGVSSTDTSLVLTAAQAAAAAPYFYFSAPAGDTVSIGDTAADIDAFLDGGSGAVAEVLQFGDISAIAATDGSIALSASEAEALEGANARLGASVAITAPAGDTVTLSDTAADIEAMSPDQLAGLTAIGVTSITVTDQSLTLSVAQALALYDPVPIVVPPGDSVFVADTETAIESLTPAELTGLAAIGVSGIETSNLTGAGPLTIDDGLTLAISGPAPANQTITFTGAGGTLSLDDTADMAGTVFGFSPPDTIDLADVPFDPNGVATLQAGDDLQVTENGVTYTLQLDPSEIFLTTPSFNLNPDSGDGTALTVSAPPIEYTYDYVFGGQTIDGAVIGQQGIVEVSGGTANRTDIQAGGELIADDGSIVQDVTLESGGLLDLRTGGAAVGVITFAPPAAGVGGTLEIDDTTTPGATIAGFTSGDTLVITGAQVSQAGLDPSGTELLLDTSNGVFTLDLSGGGYAGDTFNVNNASGVSVITVGTPAVLPVVAGPSQLDLDQYTPQALPGVSVSDSGATAGETFTVTVSDGYGLLSASGAGVHGSGSTDLTITGTLQQVNAALATLQDVDAVAGGDTISVSALDGLGDLSFTTSIPVSVATSLPSPVAGAAPTVTAVDGAPAAISYGALTDLVTDVTHTPLSVVGVALAQSSQDDGYLGSNGQDLEFFPAAGFAGTAVVDVTLEDGAGLSVVQPLDVDVVVAPSPPVPTTVTSPPTVASTIVQHLGDETIVQQLDANGDQLSATITTVNGGVTQVQDFNGDWVQTAASITTVNGDVTTVQEFDGDWNQTSAALTTVNGGETIVQDFNGGWVQTAATITTVNGGQTIVQDFDGDWSQTSATITTVDGGQTIVQDFDGGWSQTAATITAVSGGVTTVQDFNGNWVQTAATITTVDGGMTTVQAFNGAWVQTAAVITTVNGDQTITQDFDGDWNLLGATVQNGTGSAGTASQLFTYGPGWSLESEVDTAANGGRTAWVYGQRGGGATLASASGYSTSFIIQPGELNGDTFAGLNTLNLGGSLHDVVDFEGYGPGAQLYALGGDQWEVVSADNPTETFTVTGGGSLETGDYAFVGPGDAGPAAPVNPTASLSLFAIDGDGLISAANAAAGVTLMGVGLDSPTADLVGQTVTVTLNGASYTGVIQTDGDWSVAVGPAALAALTDGKTYQVEASVADTAGQVATAQQTVTVDETARLSIAPVGGNGVITAADVASGVTLTGASLGSIGDGDFAGQAITVTLAGDSFEGAVAANGTWSVQISAAALAALNDGQAYTLGVAATDDAGNAATATTTLLVQDDGLALGPHVLVASGPGQTLGADGATDTFWGASAGGDTIQGTAAALDGATIVNFGYTGDQIHLADVAASGSAPSFVEDASNTFGVLTATDGTHTASVILFGQFMAADFKAMTDGGAGEIITYTPPVAATPLVAPH